MFGNAAVVRIEYFYSNSCLVDIALVNCPVRSRSNLKCL
uniref:Uncharacterized protein n=1 Tax=Arundo donax TaxID=35708 RepID=A0A0A8YVS7_ARUDO